MNLEQNDQTQNHAQMANHSSEVLIVASKLKSFVKESSGLNTSGNVMEALSGIVREVTLRAADNAKADGRKTLMGRDFTDILK